jgi:hypothetical protein
MDEMIFPRRLLRATVEGRRQKDWKAKKKWLEEGTKDTRCMGIRHWSSATLDMDESSKQFTEVRALEKL